MTLPVTPDKDGDPRPVLTQPDDDRRLDSDPFIPTTVEADPDLPTHRDPWTASVNTPPGLPPSISAQPELIRFIPDLPRSVERPRPPAIRPAVFAPRTAEPPGIRDILRLGHDDEDIKVIAIGKQPENGVAPDTDAPLGKRPQLWQIAAVAITLTAATTVLRQIRSRAKAQAAKLAALAETPTFAAAVLPKSSEGAYLALEQLGDSQLRILNEPAHGKLSVNKAVYTYEPNRAAENKAAHASNTREDHFTYATETGSGKVDLRLQTANDLPQIAHVEHHAEPNHYAPLRLTVKAGKAAPTLVITDPVANNNGQTIALPTLQITPHDQTATASLSITLARFPQGSTVSDGEHSWVLTESEPIDVTQWNLNTLTFLPPANFEGSFTLNLRATERKADQPDATTSVSIKVSAATGKGSQRPNPGRAGLASAGNVSSRSDETVSAKVASVTVHSSLPEAKPQEEEAERYIVLNLASSRPPQSSRQSAPKPTINWSGQAPDLEAQNMGWVGQFFSSTKEKVRTLAERTGLRFKMEER